VIAINVSSNADRILADVALTEREMKTALMRALNRTADGVKTDAGREIRKSYNVTAKALNGTDRRAGAFDITRATTATLIARVTASGRPLQLIGFAPRQTKAGVSVAVRKGSRKVLEHAFIARMKSGHAGVFVRRSQKRLPIDEKYTISVPGMLGAKQVQTALRPLAMERFDKAFEQNLRFVLVKRGG